MCAVYGIWPPTGADAAPPYSTLLPQNVIYATVSATEKKIPKPHGGLGEKDRYNLMRVLELERDEYQCCAEKSCWYPSVAAFCLMWEQLMS